MNTLKIAQIGCTHPYASAHVAALAACEDVVSIILCDADVTAAASLRVAIPERVEAAVLDLESVLKASDIRAVSISLPLRENSDIVARAARAGKHILCEPPVASDTEALAAALESAQRANVAFEVGFTQRHRPEAVELRRQVAKGTIGSLLSIELRAVFEKPRETWFLDPQLGGGLLRSVAGEYLDLVRWLSDSEVVAVGARLNEDSGAIVLQCANGAVGTFHFGWVPAAIESDVAIVLRGTGGTISLDPGNNSDHATLKIQAPRLTRDIQFQHGNAAKRELEARLTCVRVLAAALKNGQSSQSTATSALAVSRLLDACVASNASDLIMPLA